MQFPEMCRKKLRNSRFSFRYPLLLNFISLFLRSSGLLQDIAAQKKTRVHQICTIIGQPLNTTCKMLKGDAFGIAPGD